MARILVGVIGGIAISAAAMNATPANAQWLVCYHRPPTICAVAPASKGGCNDNAGWIDYGKRWPDRWSACRAAQQDPVLKCVDLFGCSSHGKTRSNPEAQKKFW